MASSPSSGRGVRGLLLPAVVLLLVLVGAEPAAACYPRVFSFGDSLADTGNFIFLYGNHSEPALRPPYGETFFRRATGRFSNGRLVVDFIADTMGLPFVPPYLSGRKAEDFACGANFAVGGATALSPDFFRAKGFNIGERVHLDMEMKWFRKLLDLLCPGDLAGCSDRELEQIWTEIGEREQDKDRMFQELEMECMRVYRRKVDSANAERAQLRQSLMAKEAELKAIVASIGENTPRFKVDEKHTSLKDQLAAVTPLLEDLRAKKEERIKQISNVQSQIEKIKVQISDHNNQNNDDSVKHLNDDSDLSIRRLSDLQMQLRNLQKEKSDRLQKVFIYVDEVHCLCAVLGMDFAEIVKEVHPSLHETNSENSTNISYSTLEGLTQAILMLKAEKKTRVLKLQEIVEKLHKLWNLMESTEQERRHFAKVAAIVGFNEEEITSPGILSLETIQETEEEVERLTKEKASRMKELVLKKRLELEDICRLAHMEPDMSTAPEKIIALIDSGLVDPCELLSSIEVQITKAKEESLTRKDIMDRVDKWLSACDEETWLEEYNQDDNRYSAGRGAHLNLKRAEKARVLVQKIPTMIDNLIAKTFAWEDERNVPFLYDGVRLVAILEEQKLRRAQRDEDRRRSRDQKKLQSLLLKEKELIFGSKPSPRRTSSFNRRASSHHPNGNGAGFMTPVPRRVSAGSATPELLTPRSYSGRYNNYFKENRRLTPTPLNFSTASKEDSMSSFASISGSEPDSPLYLH